MVELSLILPSIFLLGCSGFVTVPRALADASWSGIIMLIICCANTLYAAICFGKSWTILLERYDEYKEKKEYPYAAIAYRAFGKRMKNVIAFCSNFTLLGVAIVHLLLASQLITSLTWRAEISYCYWVLILAAILCPLMWLGTPDNSRPAATLTQTVTIVIPILIFVALMMTLNFGHQHQVVEAPSVMNFFRAFGAMMFAFAGASSTLVFQNDMDDYQKFQTSVIIGFLALLLFYLLISLMGFLIYGNGFESGGIILSLQPNIIMSLPDTPMRSVIEFLLLVHFLIVFLLVIDTSAQEFEEFFSIPKRIGWKRCLLRTAMLLIVLFGAASFPTFHKILSLVGGSTVTLTASVFPCLFYFKLCHMSSKDPQWPQRCISLPEKIYLFTVVIIGIVVGGIATCFALKAIVKPSLFHPPCYVNVTAANAQIIWDIR